MTRIVAVTSGKAGVGKTHLSVGLALQCARKGLRTCLFDVDLGFSNATALLGLNPQHSLHDVVTGSCSLTDVLISSQGLDIIHNTTGSTAIDDLASAGLARLAEEFSTLAPYDLIIFDISSNLATPIQALVAAAPETVLILTPDPNSLTDSYALVKCLQRHSHKGKLRVIVNQAQSERQAQHTYEKFREVVRVYQGVELQLLGWVPYATPFTQIMLNSANLVPTSESPVDQALAELTEQFVHVAPESTSASLPSFWSRLIGAVTPAQSLTELVVEPEAAASRVQLEPTEYNTRLLQLETGMETVLQELRMLREVPGMSDVALTHDETTEDELMRPARLSRTSRRNTDSAGPARFVRNAQRSTPIDALQLRRVVGRMLVKATPIDASADTPPVQISVDQLQVDGNNEYSLRPGRYTRVSLHCQDIRQPDSFVEEIFSTCAISGCKVRHLGSHVRYWVTSGRDGCILLDGDDTDRNCVQVYMAAGGNNLQDVEAVEPESVPRLRRVTDSAWSARTTPEQLLGKYPHQRLLVEGTGTEAQEVFHLLRRDRSPLLCAFHKADGESAAGHRRESSP